MKRFLSALKPVLVCFLAMTVLCGLVYPGIVTGIAQALFPYQANGSIITVTKGEGTSETVGSALIGQAFTQPQYLIGRPMGTSNLSPVGEEQKTLVEQRIQYWHSLDPENAADVPADLVTASASGVDPNISPSAAEYQVARVAKERGMAEEDVRAIIREYTTGRLFGFWGEPAVNVLKVNLALDGLI